MRKLILLFAVIMFSFTACNEDPVEQVTSELDQSSLEVQSTEDDEPNDEELPPREQVD